MTGTGDSSPRGACSLYAAGRTGGRSSKSDYHVPTCVDDDRGMSSPPDYIERRRRNDSTATITTCVSIMRCGTLT